jgi:hypothetical protein
MKDLLRQTFKIYKYFSLAFFLAYSIYIVMDDYIFIEKYWESYWLEYLGLGIIYFLMYFLVFSFYFWIVAIGAIFVYSKIIKPRRAEKNA